MLTLDAKVYGFVQKLKQNLKNWRKPMSAGHWQIIKVANTGTKVYGIVQKTGDCSLATPDQAGFSFKVYGFVRAG